MSTKVNITEAYHTSANKFRYDTNTVTSSYLEKFTLPFPY